jgi:putative FmdB family regulatory protein
MPIYEYVCHECGTTEESYRSLYERNMPKVCGQGHKMERIYSVPALAIWNADRPFPNAVNFGDGKFPTKAAYESHLKSHDMAESSTTGRNKSIIPRSMRK